MHGLQACCWCKSTYQTNSALARAHKCSTSNSGDQAARQRVQPRPPQRAAATGGAMSASREAGPAWRPCERGSGCAAPAAPSSQTAGWMSCSGGWELEESPATRARQRQRLQPGRRLLRTTAGAASCSSGASPLPGVAASQPRFASIAAAHAPAGGKQFSADGLQAVPAAVMEGEWQNLGRVRRRRRTSMLALLLQSPAAHGAAGQLHRTPHLALNTTACRLPPEAVCLGRASAAGA